MTRKLQAVTRAQWAKQIREVHDQIIRKTVEGFIGLGRMLSKAKDDLEYGDFTAMIERDLPFSPRTAQRLMAIADDQRLPTHASVLPPSWTTLYELTRLPDETFDRAIAEGTINPDMERADVEQLQRIIPKIVVRTEPRRVIIPRIVRISVEPRPVFEPEIVPDEPRDNREGAMSSFAPGAKEAPRTPERAKAVEHDVVTAPDDVVTDDELDYRQWVTEDAITKGAKALELIRIMMARGPLTQLEADAIRNHGMAWIALAEEVEGSIRSRDVIHFH